MRTRAPRASIASFGSMMAEESHSMDERQGKGYTESRKEMYVCVRSGRVTGPTAARANMSSYCN